MVQYKCTVCGYVQSMDGQCDSCHNQGMIQMMQDLRQELHPGIYADGGCLGCTEDKRQKTCYAISAICLIAGLFFFISGEITYGLVGCAASCLWGALGYFFPNGPCGQFKQKVEPHQNLLD